MNLKVTEYRTEKIEYSRSYVVVVKQGETLEEVLKRHSEEIDGIAWDGFDVFSYTPTRSIANSTELDLDSCEIIGEGM